MKIIRYFPLANMQSHRIHLFIFPLSFPFDIIMRGESKGITRQKLFHFLH